MKNVLCLIVILFSMSNAKAANRTSHRTLIYQGAPQGAKTFNFIVDYITEDNSTIAIRRISGNQHYSGRFEITKEINHLFSPNPIYTIKIVPSKNKGDQDENAYYEFLDCLRKKNKKAFVDILEQNKEIILK